MKKIILTDADGVLVLWLAGFEKFMAAKGYKLIPDTEHSYSISPRYGITTPEVDKLVHEFNTSAFITDLPAYRDSVEYVGKLVDHGFKFVCISSLSSAPDAHKYRKINLEGLFGNAFIELICLEMGAHKGSALLPWKDSGLFWIEDHIKNAEAGHELGLKSVLVMQDHNSHYNTDKFNVVGPLNPWQEIYHIICKEYNLPI